MPQGLQYEYHRGYMIFNRSLETGLTTVKYNYKAINYHMPRKFVWTGESEDELKDYIAALYDRRALQIKAFEDAGLVADQAYEEPPEEVPMVKVSGEMLLAVALGEMPLEMPITGQLLYKPTRDGMAWQRIPVEIADSGLVDAYHQAVLD